MFIVPVKGVYAFHLTIQKTGVSNNDLTVHIIGKSNLVSGAHVNEAIWYGIGSSTALMEVAQNDQVYAQVHNGGIHSGSWHGVGTVQFTGYLLYSLL